MTRYRKVDGELVEITEAEYQADHATWEYYRGPSGEPFGRKVTPDGTVLEEDVSVPEASVEAQEHKQAKENVDLGAALSAVLSSAPAKSVVDILVAKGVLTVEEAEDAGWTPS